MAATSFTPPKSYKAFAFTVAGGDLDLRDDNLLRNLDERCVRSLGGALTRVAPPPRSGDRRLARRGRDSAPGAQRARLPRRTALH